MILFALVEARTTPAPSSVMRGISWRRVRSQERSNQRFPSFLRRGQGWWRSERRYGALPFYTSHFFHSSPERSQESAPGGSTWLLYSQYKAHVLGVQRSCTRSTKPKYCARANLPPPPRKTTSAGILISLHPRPAHLLPMSLFPRRSKRIC